MKMWLRNIWMARPFSCFEWKWGELSIIKCDSSIVHCPRETWRGSLRTSNCWLLLPLWTHQRLHRTCWGCQRCLCCKYFPTNFPCIFYQSQTKFMQNKVENMLQWPLFRKLTHKLVWEVRNAEKSFFYKEKSFVWK